MIGRLRRLFTRKSVADRREDLFLSALDRLVEAQTRQVEAFSEAIKANSAAFQAALAPYRVDGKPESWVVTEEDELLRELERAGVSREQAETQLRWVLDQSGR